MENYEGVFFTIFAVGALIGAFKSIDWAISTKYKTKEECENCRKSILEIINRDRDLLVRLDAKMDLVLEQMKEKRNES